MLADRYIYTLMARDMVRGMDEAWLKNLYGIALVPDAVFYLNVSPEELVQRNFAKKHALDYWESGMDLGLSRDMFDSFMKYQAMGKTFGSCNPPTDLRLSMASSAEAINAELRKKIGPSWQENELIFTTNQTLNGDTALSSLDFRGKFAVPTLNAKS